MSHPNQSILVVDDEVIFARPCADLFHRAGWTADWVDNGRDAIAFVRKDPVDVVLLDMRMSPLDGFATLTEILQVRPDTCVVFLTGYGDVPHAVKALQMGAMSMIDKSNPFDVLQQLVRHALELKQKELTLKQKEASQRAEKEMAIKAAAVKESTLTLAMGLGHQLRTRTAQIGMCLELARTDTTQEQRLKRLDEIQEAILDVDHIIDTLKQFSRLPELRRTRVALLSSVSRGAERARWLLRYSAIGHLRTEIRIPDGLIVSADESFLDHAFECLVHNALKAFLRTDVPSGSVLIASLPPQQGKVTVVINDNGPGFPPDLLNKAHLPFATTSGATNLGLGLTFAKEVIERGDGSLRYGNQKSGGAFVEISLPLSS